MATHVDFAWPLAFAANGDLTKVFDASAVRQKLKFGVLTRLREMLLSSEGSTLPDAVFDQNDAFLRAFVENACRDLAARSAPEVEILAVLVNYNEDETALNLPEDFVRVRVAYRSRVAQTEETADFLLPRP